MTATIVMISIITVLGLVVFGLTKHVKKLKNDIAYKNDVIQTAKHNNLELQKALDKLQSIDKEKEKEIEEIKNSPVNGIADILNYKLSNSGG